LLRTQQAIKQKQHSFNLKQTQQALKQTQ